MRDTIKRGKKKSFPLTFSVLSPWGNTNLQRFAIHLKCLNPFSVFFCKVNKLINSEKNFMKFGELSFVHVNCVTVVWKIEKVFGARTQLQLI